MLELDLEGYDHLTDVNFKGISGRRNNIYKHTGYSGKWESSGGVKKKPKSSMDGQEPPGERLHVPLGEAQPSSCGQQKALGA